MQLGHPTKSKLKKPDYIRCVSDLTMNPLSPPDKDLAELVPAGHLEGLGDAPGLQILFIFRL